MRAPGHSHKRRNAEDPQVLAADADYSWSDLREECRSESVAASVAEGI